VDGGVAEADMNGGVAEGEANEEAEEDPVNVFNI